MMKLLISIVFVIVFDVAVNGVNCNGNCGCGNTDPCTLKLNK